MITSEGKTLGSKPCLQFGRSPFFIRYDVSTESWQALGNEALSQMHGAGVAASQSLINQGVSIAISGKFGPNAFQALSTAGIEMVTIDPSFQTVQDVIEAYKNNKLTKVSSEK
jgi:predicted Fe-Mo cluster-binding NifX family protein